MAASRPFPNRQVTLRDIAIAVGVNVSTVSRVLNPGDPISVRPETRERIIAEVARTGYRPNAAGRSLQSRRTGAIGLVLPDLANPLYATITRGAVREAAELGYVMLVAELADEDSSMLDRLVSERRVDGVIVATAQEQHEQGLDDRDPTLPFVYVNRRVEGANRSVIVDDEAAGALAAEALLDEGHRRLAFIGGPSNLDTARRRRLGFVRVCAAAGVPEPLDVERPYSRAGGFDAAGVIADLRDRPTALFASNLLVGIGLLAGLREHGIGVPDDVSVITLDDEDAKYTSPPMTAVHLPFAEMGAASVREVQRILSGKAPRDITVGPAPWLVKRRSLASPAR